MLVHYLIGAACAAAILSRLAGPALVYDSVTAASDDPVAHIENAYGGSVLGTD